MALIIIILNITEIPGALFDIIQNAFGLKTAVSGGIGAALTRGKCAGVSSPSSHGCSMTSGLRSKQVKIDRCFTPISFPILI